MRILVVSDTHGDVYSLQQAVLQQPKDEVIIHLGDGASEASDLKFQYPNKAVLQVRGNCDWGSSLPIFGTQTIEGKRFFFTHGHAYHAKSGMLSLVMAARENHVDVLLFGHTHLAVTDYENGLYIMNPGTLSGSGCGRKTYGIVDITPAGIVTNIMNLR